jgi:hypothetical protein
MSSQAHGHDDWFSHASTEVAQHEHAHVINTGSLFKWLIGISLSLILTIVALFVYFDNYISRLRAGQIIKADGTAVPGIEVLTNAESNAMKAAEDEILGVRDGKVVSEAGFNYTASPQVEGRLRIPLDAAMNKVAAQYAARPAAK